MWMTIIADIAIDMIKWELPASLSGSLIVGIIGSLSFDVLCSFCKNNDVVAICRSASIPSFILLLLPFDFCVDGAFFGYKFDLRIVSQYETTSGLHYRNRSVCTCVPRAICTRLLSPWSKEVVWSASTFAFFFFNFLRLDVIQCDGHIQKNIRSIQKNKPIAKT